LSPSRERKAQNMFKKWLFLSVAAIFAYGFIAVAVNVLRLNVSAFDGNWTETNGVYSTQIIALKRTEFCLCPAYECETGVEATMLAQPTIWGWRRFTAVFDPVQTDPLPPRPAYMAPRRFSPRSVRSGGNCTTKEKGEILALTLTPIDRYLFLTME